MIDFFKLENNKEIKSKTEVLCPSPSSYSRPCCTALVLALMLCARAVRQGQGRLRAADGGAAGRGGEAGAKHEGHGEIRRRQGSVRFSLGFAALIFALVSQLFFRVFQTACPRQRASGKPRRKSRRWPSCPFCLVLTRFLCHGLTSRPAFSFNGCSVRRKPSRTCGWRGTTSS